MAPTAEHEPNGPGRFGRVLGHSSLHSIFGLSKSIGFEQKIKPFDLDAADAEWTERLSAKNRPEYMHETIGRAYDSVMSLVGRVEAKAVGVLQVIAVVFASLAIVVTDSATWVRILAVVPFLYLVLATVGALHVLRIRSLVQVTSRTATHSDGGLVGTAVAAAMVEHASPSPSNFLHGAIRDLVVAGTIAALLLVSVLLGVGREEAEPVERGSGADAPAQTDRTSGPGAKGTSGTSVRQAPHAGAPLPSTAPESGPPNRGPAPSSQADTPDGHANLPTVPLPSTG